MDFPNNKMNKFGPIVIKCMGLVLTNIIFAEAFHPLHGYLPPDPVVRIPDGEIRGITMMSRYGRPFRAFRGIPYAKPPLGNLRFRSPKSIGPWNGTLDATKESPICIQKNYLFANPKVEGNEDCLYLNVYVPIVALENGPLPVMVSIHWGGFLGGRGTSDFMGPKYLMDKNVILVTFNYRLGILGFLSTLDDEAPGNYALKDQVAALKWVKKNIQYFNGDPNRVTIFGNSAGAGSVQLHLLSPLSKGLFHSGISQSGSALALWATPLNELHKQIVGIQATYFGCNTNSSKLLITCLRQTSAEDLLNSQDIFKFFSVDPLIVYTLVKETKTRRNPHPFITKFPVEYIKDGETHNVPWIIGVVKNEGSIRGSPIVRQTALREAFNANFSTLMKKELYYEVSVGQDQGKQEEIYKKTQSLYMKGEVRINPEDPANIQGFVDIWSDRSIIYPGYQSMMLHSAVGHGPIWVFNFEYEGQYTYESKWAATNETVSFNWGASHCDDALYIFDSPGLFPQLQNAKDLEMSEILLDRWTNFAKNGDPQRTDGVNYWEKLNFTGLKNMKNENLFYLHITGSASGKPIGEKMQRGFYKERMLFWASQKLLENFDGLQ